jgi:hypothetical protein
MDPAIIDVSTKVLAVLLPFVTKGAEEFASKVGDAAYEKAKTLLTVLKQKWSGDKEATESLALFEQKPQRYQAVLEDILQEKLVEDHDLVVQVVQLLQEMGPTLEIIQRMEEGEGITGVEAGELHTGTVKSTQDIKRGKDVWGVRIDRIG